MAHQSSENQAHKRSVDAASLDVECSVQIPVIKSLIPGFLPYFETYGEIENMTVSIRFKEKKVAESVLRKRFHKIENTVWTAEPHGESSKCQSINFDQTSPAHILDLKDDTLMKIFKYLNSIDLAHASETCIRFDSVAKKVFLPNPSKLLWLMEHPGPGFSSFHDVDHADVFLPRFGDSVKEIQLERSDTDKGHLDTMTKYCKNVETFELSSPNIGMNDLKKIVSSFPKLDYLVLFGNFEENDDINDCLMTSNSSVQDLEIDCVDDAVVPNLTVFTTLMPNIQNFSFVYFPRFCCLKFTESDIKKLCQWKSLKHLRITECKEIALVALFNGLQSSGVEDIDIGVQTIAEPIDDIISAITKVKTIKVLELASKHSTCGDLEDHHLVCIGKGLPLLVGLHIELPTVNLTIKGLKETLRHANRLMNMCLTKTDDLVLSTADYQAMVDTVKRRPEKLKLEIEMTLNLNDIEADVRERNSEWLVLHVIKG